MDMDFPLFSNKRKEKISRCAQDDSGASALPLPVILRE